MLQSHSYSGRWWDAQTHRHRGSSYECQCADDGGRTRYWCSITDCQSPSLATESTATAAGDCLKFAHRGIWSVAHGDTSSWWGYLVAFEDYPISSENCGGRKRCPRLLQVQMGPNNFSVSQLEAFVRREYDDVVGTARLTIARRSDYILAPDMQITVNSEQVRLAVVMDPLGSNQSVPETLTVVKEVLPRAQGRLRGNQIKLLLRGEQGLLPCIYKAKFDKDKQVTGTYSSSTCREDLLLKTTSMHAAGSGWVCTRRDRGYPGTFAGEIREVVTPDSRRQARSGNCYGTTTPASSPNGESYDTDGWTWAWEEWEGESGYCLCMLLWASQCAVHRADWGSYSQECSYYQAGWWPLTYLCWPLTYLSWPLTYLCWPLTYQNARFCRKKQT